VGCAVTLGVRHLERVDLLWLHGGSHRATLEARRRAIAGGRAPAGPIALRGRHRVFDQLERAALDGGARRVICPSALVRAELLERYPAAATRLTVIENGVDLERFHPRERPAARGRLRAEIGLEEEIPLIVLAARHPRFKGLPELLRALSGLGGRWHLLVAGPRRARRWLRRAGREGLAPGRVSVRSHLDPVLLAAGADLCVLPTWRDTSGLVLLEALAAGTPVVTTKYAGAAEVLGEGAAAGTVVEDPSDPDRLRQAIADQLAARCREPADPWIPRAAVEDRGLATWMKRLVAEVIAMRLVGGGAPDV